MPLVGSCCKLWIYFGFIFAWTKGARPRFDTSTDMGLVLIPADAEVDSVIFRLRATDQDADFPLVFEITATITPVVRIDNLPCTLYNKVCQANVILTKRLVPGRLHDFAVRVKDSKGDSNSMQATISVTNATTPRDKIFPHIPSLIMVPEDTKPGKELDYLLVRANSWSGKPVYIELWQPKELFTIRQRQTPTQTRGVITLIGELDFETQSMYTLTMYATDPYTEPGKDTRNIAGLNVVVVVQDVQDVPPIFTLAPPLTRINNSVQPGDIILRVHAEDGDKGVPREIAYGLVSEGNPFTPFFNISETTGEIVLAKSLEELTQITHVGAPVVLTVVAEEIRRNREEPPAQATVVEVGFLLGEPGNSPPYFESDNYVVTIDENPEPGTVITFGEQYSTKVRDEDIGKAGVFALRLENNNGTFEINPTVAERTADFIITVRDNTLIDYELYKSLSFKILAQEVGPATNLSATAPVTVFLRDINDNPPVFDEDSYEVTLSENVTVGTRVIQVHATDKDTGSLGSIRYTGITGQGSEAFTMDPDTGLITVAMGSSLDREIAPKLLLSIEAHDENGTGNRGVVPLIVNLLDVNDNAPLFEKEIYEFTLNSDLTNFTTPAVIKAMDADAEPPNNEIRYELIHGNYENKFYLNEITGELILRSPITKIRRKKQSAYENFAKKGGKEFVQNHDSAREVISKVTTISSISNSSEDTRNQSSSKRAEQINNRNRRANDDALYTLTARAYDLGVPHLSSVTQIRVLSGAVMEARIVMFVVPGEHPDSTKTAETLAAITGGRVTVLEMRPYVQQNTTGTGSTLPGSGKKSIVVARVEQTEPGTPLVDVEKIRETLAANGVGIIGGTDTITDMVTNIPMTIPPPAGGMQTSNSQTTNINKTITSVYNEEVTVYKAENKLLFWLLIILGLLMLLAIAALIICCICPGCPFYMAPRKRRVHSSETMVVKPDGRPKRHLHRKPAAAADVTWNGRKQAWSADPTRRNWQFNRRNTKNCGLASLPGDVAYISSHTNDIHVNVEPLRLRDGLIYDPSRKSRVDDQERMYMEDVEAQKIRGYDGTDLDSLQRHEMERGSDIPHQGYRQRSDTRYIEPDANEDTTVREQHFYREGNAEVLRLITRGQVDDSSVSRRHHHHHHPTTLVVDGKDIILRRFMDDQNSRHDLSMQDLEAARSMESHQRSKEICQQQPEIILIPERLELGHRQHVDELGPNVQRLVIEHGDYDRQKTEMKDSPMKEMRHRQESVEAGTSSIPDRPRGVTKEHIQSTNVQSYAFHDLELAKQNALLTRLLLEREHRHVGATVVDSTSYLETQSLPGQVAIATQTDKTAATQTDRQIRSRSDNDESDEDSRHRKKLKSKKRYGDGDWKRSRTLWMKSPIEEEGSPCFDKRLSILRKKVREVKEGRKISLEPEVLREISDSLDGNGSSYRAEEEESTQMYKRSTEQTSIRYKILNEEKNGSSSSAEADKDKRQRVYDETIHEGKTDIHKIGVIESASSPELRAKHEKHTREKSDERSPKKETKSKIQKKVDGMVKPSFKILEREITMLTKKLSKLGDKKQQESTASDSTSQDKSGSMSKDSNKDLDQKTSKKTDPLTFQAQKPSAGSAHSASKSSITEQSASQKKEAAIAKTRQKLKYQQAQVMSAGSSEYEDAFERSRKQASAPFVQTATKQKQSIASQSHVKQKRQTQTERRESKKQISQTHDQDTEKRKDGSSKDRFESKLEKAGKSVTRAPKVTAISRRENLSEDLSTSTSSDRAEDKRSTFGSHESEKRSSVVSSGNDSNGFNRRKGSKVLEQISERFSDHFVEESPQDIPEKTIISTEREMGKEKEAHDSESQKSGGTMHVTEIKSTDMKATEKESMKDIQTITPQVSKDIIISHDISKQQIASDEKEGDLFDSSFGTVQEDGTKTSPAIQESHEIQVSDKSKKQDELPAKDDVKQTERDQLAFDKREDKVGKEVMIEATQTIEPTLGEHLKDSIKNVMKDTEDVINKQVEEVEEKIDTLHEVKKDVQQKIEKIPDEDKKEEPSTSGLQKEREHKMMEILEKDAKIEQLVSDIETDITQEKERKGEYKTEIDIQQLLKDNIKKQSTINLLDDSNDDLMQQTEAEKEGSIPGSSDNHEEHDKQKISEEAEVEEMKTESSIADKYPQHPTNHQENLPQHVHIITQHEYTAESEKDNAKLAVNITEHEETAVKLVNRCYQDDNTLHKEDSIKPEEDAMPLIKDDAEDKKLITKREESNNKIEQDALKSEEEIAKHEEPITIREEESIKFEEEVSKLEDISKHEGIVDFEEDEKKISKLKDGVAKSETVATEIEEDDIKHEKQITDLQETIAKEEKDTINFEKHTEEHVHAATELKEDTDKDIGGTIRAEDNSAKDGTKTIQLQEDARDDKDSTQPQEPPAVYEEHTLKHGDYSVVPNSTTKSEETPTSEESMIENLEDTIRHEDSKTFQETVPAHEKRMIKDRKDSITHERITTPEDVSTTQEEISFKHIEDITPQTDVRKHSEASVTNDEHTLKHEENIAHADATEREEVATTDEERTHKDEENAAVRENIKIDDASVMYEEPSIKHDKDTSKFESTSIIKEECIPKEGERLAVCKAMPATHEEVIVKEDTLTKRKDSTTFEEASVMREEGIANREADTAKCKDPIGFVEPPITSEKSAVIQEDIDKHKDLIGLEEPPVISEKGTIKQEDTDKHKGPIGFEEPPVTSEKDTVKQEDTEEQKDPIAIEKSPDTNEKGTLKQEDIDKHKDPIVFEEPPDTNEKGTVKQEGIDKYKDPIRFEEPPVESKKGSVKQEDTDKHKDPIQFEEVPDTSKKDTVKQEDTDKHRDSISIEQVPVESEEDSIKQKTTDKYIDPIGLEKPPVTSKKDTDEEESTDKHKDPTKLEETTVTRVDDIVKQKEDAGECKDSTGLEEPLDIHVEGTITDGENVTKFEEGAIKSPSLIKSIQVEKESKINDVTPEVPEIKGSQSDKSKDDREPFNADLKKDSYDNKSSHAELSALSLDAVTKEKVSENEIPLLVAKTEISHHELKTEEKEMEDASKSEILLADKSVAPKKEEIKEDAMLGSAGTEEDTLQKTAEFKTAVMSDEEAHNKDTMSFSDELGERKKSVGSPDRKQLSVIGERLEVTPDRDISYDKPMSLEESAPKETLKFDNLSDKKKEIESMLIKPESTELEETLQLSSKSDDTLRVSESAPIVSPVPETIAKQIFEPDFVTSVEPSEIEEKLKSKSEETKSKEDRDLIEKESADKQENIHRPLVEEHLSEKENLTKSFDDEARTEEKTDKTSHTEEISLEEAGKEDELQQEFYADVNLPLFTSIIDRLDDSDESDSSSDISRKTTLTTRPYQTPRHRARISSEKENTEMMESSDLGSIEIDDGAELTVDLAEYKAAELSKDDKEYVTTKDIDVNESSTADIEQKMKEYDNGEFKDQAKSSSSTETHFVPAKISTESTSSLTHKRRSLESKSSSELDEDLQTVTKHSKGIKLGKSTKDRNEKKNVKGVSTPVPESRSTQDSTVIPTEGKAKQTEKAKTLQRKKKQVSPDKALEEKGLGSEGKVLTRQRLKKKSANEQTKQKVGEQVKQKESEQTKHRRKSEDELQRKQSASTSKMEKERKSSSSGDKVLSPPKTGDTDTSKTQPKYMAWYKKNRDEMEKKKSEIKMADDDEQLPRWLRRSMRSRKSEKTDKKKVDHKTPETTPRTKRKVKPLVNVESEQLKAIVRQGRKLRKAEGGKNEDPPVQIFATTPPAAAPLPDVKHRLMQHSEYKYEKIPPPFYLHPPPAPHPSPQLSPERFEAHSSMECGHEDLDSDITVPLQGGGRLRHQQLLEKKSVFDIAYNEAAPSQLRSDSTTPPS